ncbi:MAG: FlgD immunoglobulin-like domain containing protein [bacterium]
MSFNFLRAAIKHTCLYTVLVFSVLCTALTARAQVAGKPIADTFGDFSRGNQSKTFYHGGFWWLVAPANIDKCWYLWKFNGTAWVKGPLISIAPKCRPDVWREPSNNKLYILLPGASTTTLLRMAYSGSSWSVESGYPKNVNAVQIDIMNLVRAKNGHLWVFWIADSTLRAQRSGNEAQTWSTVITLKSHLNEEQGLTDAVALQMGGVPAIGVGYAEDSGTPNSRFGFLYHRDSDGQAVWWDETSSLPAFSNTTADDHIAMATYNQQVYMIVKTKGGGQTVVKNALYHRRINGDWVRYTIFNGDGWTRPAITIDATNQVLCVLGMREGTPRRVEMKRVKLGSFGGLQTAPIVTVLADGLDNFMDITLPGHNVNGNMDLMVVASNDTENNLWYRRINMNPVPKSAPESDPEEEPAITGLIDDYKLTAEVYPNPFNPRTTVRFRLQETAPVRLQIFNLSGQLVHTLLDDELPAGEHERLWNARNHNGEAVASGIYIYRLQAGHRIATGRMQLLK